LFRRGLLTINGRGSVDHSIFHDSANVEEGHLVELLISEKCNLACRYCLAGANPHMQHMSESTARRAIDLAFAMTEAESITFEFSGGEPFLRFDLMRDLVDYINQHPARNGRKTYVCVQSNGTLLNPERVDWLQQNQIQIGLSFDGNPTSHNHSRPQVNGKESFSSVLQGLDLLQSAGIEFGVLVVLNRSNINSAQELIDFLIDNGIYSVKLNPVAFLGTAREAWEEVGLEQEQIVEYFQTFTRLLFEQNHNLVEANLNDMLKHIISKRRKSRCLRGHCGAGQNFQAITATGEIFPCGRSTQCSGLAMAHVDDAIESLSVPGRANVYIQQISQRRPETLEGCAQCAYRQQCQSGCSVQAFETYGTVKHRTPECRFWKTMYPYLMHWISSDPAVVSYLDQQCYFGDKPGMAQWVSHDFLPEFSAC
jgi:radical SAM protein with 4Fe4S-binding SPASM domain